MGDVIPRLDEQIARLGLEQFGVDIDRFRAGIAAAHAGRISLAG